MDLHRHDENSLFDGFGKPTELAKIAKEKGYTWLGISNHGTTAGNIQHYFACKEQGVKPIMGVECYHEPVFKPEKKQRKSYHLCLYAKNLQGYINMNTIMTEAENNKYYTARVTFDLLEKYHEGIICTTACVASYPAQAIIAGKDNQAFMWLKKMCSIFGDDLYVEIQPYTVDDEGTQELVNKKLIDFADDSGIKCILTSDSHRGNEDDLDSYLKMHQIAKHDSYDINATYKERYMPDKTDMYRRFINLHGKHKKYTVLNAKQRSGEFMRNLEALAETVEPDILDQLKLQMPVFDETLTDKEKCDMMIKEIMIGLDERGKKSKKYVDRCKKEFNVIRKQGFVDYFLIVQDYIEFAKQNDIMVGYGRGSVCNSLVAYAMGITKVDSIRHGLDFNRFMREGKNKIPDIDTDFETDRRIEVIKYMIQKYKGRSAQISSYGLYKVDNLLNDLFKVCGVDDKNIQAEIKRFVRNPNGLNASDEIIPVDDLSAAAKGIYDDLNAEHDDILVHFYALYNKVRYFGTHAAGVAITADDINKYTALRKDKDGNWFSVHDLVDLERINVVKFDILGLKTLNIIKDLRKETGVQDFNEDWIDDEQILTAFREGNTDGVFQFDRPACQDILTKIETDCFNDVIATNAMNRPASLKLQMPDRYADHKQNQDDLKDLPYWKYVSETYGCIIYQEQVLALAINIGGFTPDEADILVKMEHGAASRTKQVLSDKYYTDFKKKFIDNAQTKGVSATDALDLFNACAQYGFNKGHSTGYSLLSLEECQYLVNYPAEYFYTKIKYAKDEAEQERFCAKAFANGIVVFIPHINQSDVKTKMAMYDGEKVILKGLATLKGVGEKAAEFIVNERRQNGKFKTLDDFIDRCKTRAVTSRVRTILEENGACDIKHSQYMKRVTKYNSVLYMKAGAHHGK